MNIEFIDTKHECMIMYPRHKYLPIIDVRYEYFLSYKSDINIVQYG